MPQSTFAQASKEDPKLVASSLYIKALKLETEDMEYPKAIDTYKKIIDIAPDEKEFSAKALYRIGLCYEKMDPEDIESAQKSYQQIMDSYSSEEEMTKKAEEKIKLKGVDVYAAKFKTALREWRDSNTEDAKLLGENSEGIWNKIKPLDKEAIYGLMSTFNDEDYAVRNFFAQKLSLVADEDAIVALIKHLEDPIANIRAGSAVALQYVLNIARDVARYIDEANQIREGLSTIEQNQATQLLNYADQLEAKAKTVLHNLPLSLATDEIMVSLEKIVTDPQGRREAKISALSAISVARSATDTAEEAIIALLSSDNVELRTAAIDALGGIKSAKALSKLMELAQYEPEKDTVPHQERDWTNEPIVRRTAVTALAGIGKILGVPAIIEALDDNDLRTRVSAYTALRNITDKNLEYRPDDKPEERIKSQGEWQKWWQDTGGVDVLMERFNAFSQKWFDFPPEKLFDYELFMDEVRNRATSFAKPEEIINRAEKAFKYFTAKKDLMASDIVELGSSAAPYLLDRMGGQSDKKQNLSLTFFTADVIAKIIGAQQDYGLLEQCKRILRDESDVATKRLGAAIALGKIPKETAQGDEAEVIAGTILDSKNSALRRVAAETLGILKSPKVSDKLNAAALDSDESVQIAAIIALGKIGDKNDETVKTLEKVIKEAKSALPRQYAARTLGLIATPQAIAPLIMARTDTFLGVRNEAEKSIKILYAQDQSVAKTALDMLANSGETKVREGSAYALGDMGDKFSAKAMLYRLIDENPPRKIKDNDVRVRKSLAIALGKVGSRSKLVIEGLIKALEDDDKNVRSAGHESINAIVGGSIPSFNPIAGEDDRKSAITEIRNWLDANKNNFDD
ncbi:HEAT repeat domain-containing protein [Candidatus Peregrinibacteria bacterium]|nr:HEAT repeat domain-containing protein [Candidatus Peregrinibacteria bacterium]